MIYLRGSQHVLIFLLYLSFWFYCAQNCEQPNEMHLYVVFISFLFFVHVWHIFICLFRWNVRAQCNHIAKKRSAQCTLFTILLLLLNEHTRLIKSVFCILLLLPASYFIWHGFLNLPICKCRAPYLWPRTLW